MFIFKRTADIGEKLNKGLKIILVSKFFLISNNKFINKKKKIKYTGVYSVRSKINIGFKKLFHETYFGLSGKYEKNRVREKKNPFYKL